jgi:hypothetical protein
MATSPIESRNRRPFRIGAGGIVAGKLWLSASGRAFSFLSAASSPARAFTGDFSSTFSMSRCKFFSANQVIFSWLRVALLDRAGIERYQAVRELQALNGSK